VIVLLSLVISFFIPTSETNAGILVEACEPFATAGTPYVSGGEVKATSTVFCQTGVSTGVTFHTTIKVFRKSDHVWLYDTTTQSYGCTAPCSANYDPNLIYDTTKSYYTWVRVTVNGTSQYDTDGSGWLNY
jgi:hypothetical protein